MSVNVEVMKYRKDKEGNEISVLGFGCMRFSRAGAGIDIAKAEKEIMLAYNSGVNYYDTAYIYPGSEACLGEIVEKNGIRDSIKIATKLPQYLIKSRKAIDKYFYEQLKRLRTDYVDYYLMHMLTDVEAWNKLCALGIKEWIDAKKKSGEIRAIGFSFHGNTERFLEILDAYDWDFCQIQYNYVDEVSQAGRKGLMAAAEKGIPVIIMEPLRGGKLVDLLPRSAKEKIALHKRKMSPAELAFRWLWDQKEVTCVLSGMNSMEMVEENCRIASDSSVGDLSSDDFSLIEEVKAEIEKTTKVPCTGCAYCMPCPQGVDIPGAFRCYNEMFSEGKSAGRGEFFQVIGIRKKPALPSQCVGCGKCEKHCPQHIKIIEELKRANKALLPMHYRIATKIARWWVVGR